MSDANPFADGAAFIEGQYVPIGEARIPVLDWGFTRSDVTYDVVHVWKGSFFRLEDHLNRFERSAAAMHMTLPHTRQSLREVLAECVRLVGLREAFVEMVCTRGVPPPGSRDPRTCSNRFFAYAVPFVWIANEEQRRRGLHLVISSVQRIPPESVDPTVKNFHWGDLIRGMYEAYDRGGETAVLGGLTWLGAQARWVLAVGVVLATLLPSLSSFLRPYLPGLVALILCVSMARLDLGALARRASRPRRLAMLTVWSVALLVVTPAAVWAGTRAAGLPEAHVAALVYTFAAPPIASRFSSTRTRRPACAR